MQETEKTEIEVLKAALASERENKLADRLEKLEESIRGLNEEVETLAKSLKPIEDVEVKVSSIEREIGETKKRVPPIQTSAAVAVVAIGLLGWQLKDILQARDEISDLHTPVAEAVESLNNSTKASEDLANTVQNSLTSLDISLEESRTLLAKYNDDMLGSLSKISRFDEKLAKLSMQINLLTEQISRQAKSSFTVDSDSSRPESILDVIVAQTEGRNDPIALLAKATVLLERGSYREARQLAVEAKAKYEGEPEPAFDILIAQSYHQEGSYRHAIGAFDKALEVSDEETRITALTNMGAAYFAWAQSLPETSGDEQIALLEKAAELERQSMNLTKIKPVVFSNAAVTLNKLGRHLEALAALEEYRGEESGEIEFAFAYTFALLGRKSAALDRLSSALKLNPTLALNALLDNDFAVLRPDPEFSAILELYLPSELIAEARNQAWEDR